MYVTLFLVYAREYIAGEESMKILGIFESLSAAEERKRAHGHPAEIETLLLNEPSNFTLI